MSKPTRSTTSRGFETYDEFLDSYGAKVIVRESSAAFEPFVWVFIEGGQVGDNEGSSHLNVEQATRLRDALDTFIKETPQRWDQTENMS